ncbi:MAG: hypothetical protein DRP78_05105 [Candidatus Omnitrophota bacterium]|nr:MAG: hypothetical protein DRP78_05105 [Candidatus Omnitrophota bacterium]
MHLITQQDNKVFEDLFKSLLLQIKTPSFSAVSAKFGYSILFVSEDRNNLLETAKFLARVLVCSAQNKQNVISYCGSCNDCKLSEKLQHPDIFLIEAKGVSETIKIDDIRKLKEQENIKPYQAQRKIFIIQDAGRLTKESANALLKVLEEPAEDSVLVLLAQSVSLLLPTIVSRCQVIRVPANKIVNKKYSELIGSLCMRFFTNSDTADNQLCNDIVKLERKQVHSFLDELMFILSDILFTRLNVNREFRSICQKQKIINIADFFSLQAIDYLLEEILVTKSYINSNINVKLAVERLIKKRYSVYT